LAKIFCESACSREHICPHTCVVSSRPKKVAREFEDTYSFGPHPIGQQRAQNEHVIGQGGGANGPRLAVTRTVKVKFWNKLHAIEVHRQARWSPA
jgi:hypothetical protein